MYPGVAQLGSDGSAAGAERGEYRARRRKGCARPKSINRGPRVARGTGMCSDLSEWQQLGDCQASCASADRALVATGSAGVTRTHSRSRSIHTQYNIISGCGAAGSAGGLGPSGRRFDPCHSDHTKPSK